MTVWLSPYQCDECGSRVRYPSSLIECDTCHVKRCTCCRLAASHFLVDISLATTCRYCIESELEVSDEIRGWAQ